MTHCKILIAEDEHLIAQDISQMLSNRGHSVVNIVTTAEETVDASRALKPDVIIMDIKLKGDIDGIRAAEKIMTEHDIPIIFLTAFAEEHLVDRATDLAPYGYLLKPFREKELLILIELAWQRHRYEKGLRNDIERLKVQIRKNAETTQHLREISLVDDLTGMYNRRGFYDLAGKQLKVARRTGKGFLIYFFDLDCMKIINDSYGHCAGDNALLAAAGILKKVFRSSDIISRWGGDEFVVLTVSADFSDIQAINERIIQRISEHKKGSELKYSVSMSWGIVKYEPANPVELDELIESADKKMYKNKMSYRV
jgi:diguanylate cyclase (GGDEF)-like protein